MTPRSKRLTQYLNPLEFVKKGEEILQIAVSDQKNAGEMEVSLTKPNVDCKTDFKISCRCLFKCILNFFQEHMV
jgi:hypothetical protein